MKTAPALTMTRDEATAFRAAHDRTVTELWRKSRTALAALELTELRATGADRVFGGPYSKDELVRAILDLRGYTTSKLNETTHILYHSPGVINSACEWCHPLHDSADCDCALGRAE